MDEQEKTVEMYVLSVTLCDHEMYMVMNTEKKTTDLIRIMALHNNVKRSAGKAN